MPRANGQWLIANGQNLLAKKPHAETTWGPIIQYSQIIKIPCLLACHANTF